MTLGADDRQRLADNLAGIRARIAAACRAAGRDPDEVALVAVTKYAGPAYARALLELGQRDLGENRVGHLLELHEALADAGPRWHLIGHLQRNKAKKVAGLLHAIHSLDGLEVARLLDERRPAELPPLVAYVQLRLSEADGRTGVEEADLTPLLEALADLTRVEVTGLMGLPPEGPPESARAHFRRLREVAAAARARSPRLLGGALSMGMTSDLEVAIDEGATVVRIGRALLEGLSDAARS